MTLIGIPKNVNQQVMNRNYYIRKVTNAESVKGHLTIVKRYHDLFQKNLGTIPKESKIRGIKAESTSAGFRKFKNKYSGNDIKLKLVFRSDTGKKRRNELRLYFRKEIGWKPLPGDTLNIVFYKKKTPLIWLDPFKTGQRNQTFRNLLRDKNRLIDENELKLNDKFYGNETQKIKGGVKMRRSPKLVKRCLEDSGYECEAGFRRPFFISKKTKRKYVEAHHMIPINKNNRKKFKKRLDLSENLYALSPHAHRALHHGTMAEKRKILNKLICRRGAILDIFNISKNDLIKLYEI